MSKLLQGRLPQLKSVFFITIFYLALSQLTETILYTIVTYFVTASGESGADFSNTINEIVGQYMLFFYALGAALLAATMWLADKALYRERAFWNDAHKPLWQLNRITKEELLRGLASGFMAAIIFLAISLLSGQANFLGIYITSAVGTPVFPLFFMDLLAIATLIISEEFIFRHKILFLLTQQFSPLQSVFLTSLLYLLVRHIQFQLTLMDYVNLFFLNLTVCFFYLKSKKPHRGLAYLSTLYCVLHPVAGFPLWDTESPSLFLFRNSTRASALLTGGSAGPLAGLGLCSIIFAFALGSYFAWKQGAKINAKVP